MKWYLCGQKQYQQITHERETCPIRLMKNEIGNYDDTVGGEDELHTENKVDSNTMEERLLHLYL